MGEEGETIEFYSGDETLVFWNMDDYPIPVGIDNLRSNIEEALDQMGFRGHKDSMCIVNNSTAKQKKSWARPDSFT
ncbi:unnamed protein product [Brassica oleracea var. botrytis]